LSTTEREGEKAKKRVPKCQKQKGSQPEKTGGAFIKAGKAGGTSNEKKSRGVEPEHWGETKKISLGNVGMTGASTEFLRTTKGRGRKRPMFELSLGVAGRNTNQAGKSIQLSPLAEKRRKD